MRFAIFVLWAGVARADASLPSPWGLAGNWGPLKDGLRCRLVEERDGKLAVELRNESAHALKFFNEPPMDRETAETVALIVDEKKQFGASAQISALFGIETLPAGATQRYPTWWWTAHPPNGTRLQARVLATPHGPGVRAQFWTGELSCGELRYVKAE
jgi:hypothetical protein